MEESQDKPQGEVYNFPTFIPLKVIGRNEDNFEGHVLELLAGHVATDDIIEVYSHLSRADTYLSVSVTILARSREHLDAVYQHLGSSRRVRMVI